MTHITDAIGKTSHIGFLIFPGFPMACLTSMIEPLRAANEIAGTKAFTWDLYAENAGPVTSSAQVVFDAPHALSSINTPNTAPDVLFLMSGPAARFSDPRRGDGALRSLARHGVILGGVSGGVFPLVRSGLMAQHSVSVHWCYEAAFREEFPDITTSADVMVTDATRYTVSGAAAAFDLALHMIEDQLGRDVSHEVACWFQHPLIRGHGVQQKVPIVQSPETGDRLPDLVTNAIDLFSANLRDPISIAEIASRCGVTPRQIERAFKSATGQSPSHYFRVIRMKAARQLVMYSKDPISDIAAAVGYGTQTPLVTHYKQAFGVTPAKDRQITNRFRVEGNTPVPSI
jgi:transcriptional regulator GlxA family with amidase domain